MAKSGSVRFRHGFCWTTNWTQGSVQPFCWTMDRTTGSGLCRSSSRSRRVWTQNWTSKNGKCLKNNHSSMQPCWHGVHVNWRAPSVCEGTTQPAITCRGMDNAIWQAFDGRWVIKARILLVRYSPQWIFVYHNCALLAACHPNQGISHWRFQVSDINQSVFVLPSVACWGRENILYFWRAWPSYKSAVRPDPWNCDLDGCTSTCFWQTIFHGLILLVEGKTCGSVRRGCVERGR